jgi:nucleoside phosphorylase
MSDQPSRDLQTQVRALPRTCVLFALPQERKAFRVTPSANLRIETSGAGAVNSTNAAATILQECDPNQQLLIICGFGGALIRSLQPGDLVVASSVIDASKGLELKSPPILPERAIIDSALALESNGFGLHTGALVTADRVLITAQEKRNWHEHTGAVVVDMETAAAVNVAIAAGFQWLALRAVTDESDQDMPLDFNNIADANGTVSPLKVALATLLHPASIPGMIRLGSAANRAGKNLAALLSLIIDRNS